MSAIFGILRFDGGEISARELERMSNALAYRGPDGRKFIVDGGVGLGHGLMRVNREDQFEAQPLRDRDAGLVLVADLRLDNREELAAIFGIDAAELRAMPDSALVMRAYKTWGEACAQHLLGDFVFAIWDERAQKLVLARDHMGQRYVHYYHGKDAFIFATDVAALWSHPDVPRVLSDAKIGQLLIPLHQAGKGETLFNGIFGLPGATVMTVGCDGTAGQRGYWEPRVDPAHERRDEAYYLAAYRDVLGEAVACRIRRLVRPPGLSFSGGYDSAAIAGLAGPPLAGSGHKLVAAASVMPADYRGSIRHARPWVEMCARDMPHLDVRYVTREGKTMLSGLEQSFLQSDYPTGPYHFAISELLSTLAGAGARLVMDGHGGDATLHPRGRDALARLLATFQFRRFVSELPGHLRLSGQSLGATLRSVAATLLPTPVGALWRRLRGRATPRWHRQPINREFAARLIAIGAIDETRIGAAARAGLDTRARMAAGLRRVTEAPSPGQSLTASLLGLEMTRPFYDKRVVELALAIPPDLYVKNGRNRYLACAALKDVYPREFQARWRKNDDEIPDFQRMAKSIEPQLLAEIARMERSEHLARYVDFAKIRALLAARGPDDHNSGWEQETHLALNGFVVARYVEWFRRQNR